jgi:SP family general alpha glucoside:H+ symporter-like MFS transporter
VLTYIGWLVTRGRLDEAKSNLREIRGTAYTQEELDQEMKETTAFTAIESELGASASFLDCFKGTDRRRTIIATVLCVGEQMMGIGFLGGLVRSRLAICALN